MICHMLLKITWHVLEQCKLKNKNSFISLFFLLLRFLLYQRPDKDQRESARVRPCPTDSTAVGWSQSGHYWRRYGKERRDKCGSSRSLLSLPNQPGNNHFGFCQPLEKRNKEEEKKKKK